MAYLIIRTERIQILAQWCCMCPPSVEYPSCLHTTVASMLSQFVSHTTTQVLLRHISTRPSLGTKPSASLTSPAAHTAVWQLLGKWPVHSQSKHFFPFSYAWLSIRYGISDLCSELKLWLPHMKGHLIPSYQAWLDEIQFVCVCCLVNSPACADVSVCSEASTVMNRPTLSTTLIAS